MSAFTSSNTINDPHIIDHVTGKKVMKIMETYVGNPLTEEVCESIMKDVCETFGKDTDAQVMIDTDTTEIEITVRDVNGILMKCSSLKLFKDKING
jgi:hypothetical protein